METLTHRPNKKVDYVVLRSEQVQKFFAHCRMVLKHLQLVGTALILLVKSHLVGQIRNVEAATKKVCRYIFTYSASCSSLRF